MKKLFVILGIMLCLSNANAATPAQAYTAGYHAGARHGRSEAYNNAMRTAFFVGTGIVVVAIAYSLGKSDRVTYNQNGAVVRF